MSIVVGVCPSCNQVITISKKSLFLTCSVCNDAVAMREVIANMEDLCSEPSYTGKVINLALEIEQEGDIEKALAVVKKLCECNPTNEQVAFTYVRMSGYEPSIVKLYIETFAHVGGGDQSFAEDLLDHVLDSRYTHLVNSLIKYAENKTSGKTRKKYIDILEVMRMEYTTGTTNSSDGIKSMYAFYSIGVLLNFVLAMVAIFAPLHFMLDVFIVLGAFCAEFFVMYVHGKTFGHRLEISQTERYFMVAFLCSIPLAIGGVLIGGVV